jgi:CDP-diacylglycerol--glycerol-3-phosphate 3-phosphatidyltransferase/cardiolipin synthase
MATLEAADLGRLPNILSLLRIPLAAAFPFAIDRPVLALGVLCAAGATDVLDGWIARSRGQVTAIGAIVDPISDKIFAVSVVITLLVHRMMPLWAVPALLAREILEAPLVVWVLLSPKFRRLRRTEARANVPGKLATACQFIAVMSAIIMPMAIEELLILAGAAGAVSGISYWLREIDRARHASDSSEKPPAT